MGLNWDEFAKQVQGGVSRGTETFANLTIADIQRKKDQADRVAMVKMNQDWQDDRQRADWQHNLQMDLVKRGLDKSDAIWTKNLEVETYKRKAAIDEDFNTYLGSPELQASLASMKMMGLGPVAKNISDTIVAARQGVPPDKLTPEQKSSIAMIPEGPRGRFAEIMKANAESAARLAYQHELLDLAKAQKKAMSAKSELTLDEVSNLYKGALTAVEDVVTKKSALMKEIWFTDSMQSAADHKIDVNAPLAMQKEQLMEWQKDDVGSYNRFMDGMNQMGFYDEVLSNFKPIADMWGARFQQLQGLGTKPPDPTSDDKKAYSDFMNPPPNAEPLKNPAYGRKESTKNQKGISTHIPGAHGVNAFVNNILDSAGAPYVKPKDVVQKYGLKPDAQVQVINMPEDYQAMLQNGQSMPTGVYFYDSYNKDLVVSIGGGYFIKVNQPAKSTKK